MESNLYGLTGGRQGNQRWATEPADFAATATSDSVITLSWDNAAADFLHMQIEARKEAGPWAQLAELTMATETRAHEELEADTEYGYRYRCFLHNKWTPWSEAIEETTEA